jgi:hypothetical protein
MKQDDRDHNADYWASRVQPGELNYDAYERQGDENLLDRIDNLKKLLVRSHTEYKTLAEVYNPPPTGALKNSVKD